MPSASSFASPAVSGERRPDPEDDGEKNSRPVTLSSPAEEAGSGSLTYADAAESVATRPSKSKSDLRSIIICIAGTVIVFSACGTLFAFGVYQDLYEEMSHQPDNPFTGASPAMIGLIGTIGVSFMSIGGPCVTAWTKQFSPTIVVATGGVFFGLSSILASFGTQLWHFQLSQGLLFGFGICFAYMPAMTVPPTWYSKRRALAMGIISSGTGTGGLVWSPVIKLLIDKYGYRNALRISGAVTGISLVLAALAMDWDPETKARYKEMKRLDTRSWHRKLWNVHLVDWKIARTRKFAAQIIAGSFQSGAYYIPIFFLSTYGRTFGYTPLEGATFLAVSNACNAVSKVLAGFIGDYVGRVNTLVVLTFLSTLTLLCVMLPACFVEDQSTGRALYVTFVVTYGMFASPYVALFPASLVDIFGAAEFASINGALYLARGLSSLVAIPVAGLLIRNDGPTSTPSSYWGVAVFVGLLWAVATVGTLWIKLMSRRRAGY